MSNLNNIIIDDFNILHRLPLLPPCYPFQLLHNLFQEQPYPPWLQKIRPPPCPLQHTSGQKPSWRTSDQTYDPAANPVILMWQPDQAAVEVDSSGFSIDFLSNGFRLRGAEHNINEDNRTMMFMAFAEHPFAGSTPATAR